MLKKTFDEIEHRMKKFEEQGRTLEGHKNYFKTDHDAAFRG